MYFAHCFPWNKGVMHLHRIWLLALPSVQAVLPLSMATPNASIWSFRSAVTFSLCCDYVELWRLPTARTDFLWPICFGELHEQSEQHLCCPRHWLPIWLLSTIRGVDSDFQSAAQPAFYLAGPFSLPCFTPATEKTTLSLRFPWPRDGYNCGTSTLRRDRCWAFLVFRRP